MPFSYSAPARSSLSVKIPGRSQPRATLCAPVRVAMSSKTSGSSLSVARVRQSARISLPSASVFPISTVSPLLLVSTSLGRKAFPAMAFSTQGRRTLSLKSSLDDMIIEARPRTLAAPPISFFMVSMLLGGLMSRPPVSKHTPFPTIVTSFPAESPFPQLRSTTRGSRPEEAALPTAWTRGKPLSSSDPRMTLTLAPCAFPSLSASLARSDGPKSLHGVLIRSLPRKTPSTILSASRLASSSATQSTADETSEEDAMPASSLPSAEAGDEDDDDVLYLLNA
mmetsp:Transcript_7798/g.22289  ORF Transcript_7798/g.22289 Transcript_7798/m.22289 type:complete len:281 (+) Transcript_7798:576-1418(+)